MLMIGGTLRVIMMMGKRVLRAVVMMMAARACRSAANLQIARERIGEMNVMVRVLDAVHERNIGLAGQHHRERHADHGDNTLKTGKPLPAQQDPRRIAKARAA